VGIYTVAILFSKTPVPFSRAGEENLRGYEAWCRTFGRAPSREEYVTDAWKNKSEFPPSSKVQLRIISSVNQIQGELLVVRSAAAFDRLVDEVRRQANSRTRPAAANCIIEPIVPEDMKIKCMYGLTVYRYEHQEIQAELVSALYETPDEKQAAKEAVGAALCRLQAKLNLPDPVRTPDGIYTWRR
jgi:hypothetical protein